MKFSYAFMLIIMLIYNQKVNCILCYQCRSDTEQNCDNLIEDSEYLQECKAQPEIPLNQEVFCRKIFQKLSFPNWNSRVIIRECAYIHTFSEYCYKSPWKDNKVVSCECRTDRCNKAFSVLRTLPTWIVILCICFSVILV